MDVTPAPHRCPGHPSGPGRAASASVAGTFATRKTTLTSEGVSRTLVEGGMKAARILILAVALAAADCGSGSGNAGAVCSLDETQPCDCGMGVQGYRKCRANGSGFEDTCWCSVSGAGGSSSGGTGGAGGTPALGGAGGAPDAGEDSSICVASPEVCNDLDDDCNGLIDDNASDALTWYEDQDGDGFGSSASLEACSQPSGYAALSGDCLDTDPKFHPGASESCTDPNDYDCDGSTPYSDLDKDGVPACVDCNDMDPSIGSCNG